MLLRTLMVFSATAILAACQTTVPSKEPVRTSVEDMYFNTAMFVQNRTGIAAEHRLTDRGLSVIERMSVNSDFIFIQHVRESWFNRETQQEFSSREGFDEFVKDNTGGTATNVTSVKGISRGVVGYRGEYKGCTYFHAGKRIKGATIYDNDHGLIDAIFLGRDCGQMRLDLAKFLSEIDRMDNEERRVLSLGGPVVASAPSTVKNEAIEGNIIGQLTVSGSSRSVSGTSDWADQRIIFDDATLGVCIFNWEDDDETGRSGTWNMACGKGRTAGGTFLRRLNGPYEADGTTDKGEDIRMTIGA